jgi:hypothetical protein
VRGFNIDPQGTGGGIAGSAGDTGGGTIGDVNIVDAGTAGTQPGLELDATTGTWDISNLTVSNSGAPGVRLNNAGTVNFHSAGTISVTTSGAKGLDAAGTNVGTSTFDAITVTGSATGGVAMTNTTGITTFGDLALTTTSGATPAFLLSIAGAVSGPSTGAANLSATGGPAVDVTGTSGATLSFDDVDSTNSSTDGINLDGLGAGTVSATSGDVTGAAGISFNLNGGSGNVTYAGNLGNGSGLTAVDITGRSGGTVTLSGNISDTNDAGGGITLSGNTGGSTTFSGATKTLNTGTSDAIDTSSNTGHTMTFSGGGLHRPAAATPAAPRRPVRDRFESSTAHSNAPLRRGFLVWHGDRSGTRPAGRGPKPGTVVVSRTPVRRHKRAAPAVDALSRTPRSQHTTVEEMQCLLEP